MVMVMNELTLRLKSNLENQIKKEVELLKQHGYILYRNLNENSGYKIYSYNAKKEHFIYKCEVVECSKIINIDNHYNFDIYNFVNKAIMEILPKFNNNEINNFFQYMQNKSIVNQEKDLKKQLTKLKKENKKLLETVSNPELEILLKNFVIYDNSNNFRRGFYYYSKNKFINLNSEDIEGLFIRNGINNLKGYQLTNKLKDYKHNIINSDIPSRFIELEKAKNNIKISEKDYLKVKEVTDNFI